MDKRKAAHKPAWKFLYLIAFLIVGLLFLVDYMDLSSGWTRFLEGDIVVLGFGIIALWLELNRHALLNTLSNDVSDEYPPTDADGTYSELYEPPQPDLGLEDVQRQFNVDYRRILDLDREREENLKGRLN